MRLHVPLHLNHTQLPPGGSVLGEANLVRPVGLEQLHTQCSVLGYAGFHLVDKQLAYIISNMCRHSLL